MKKFFIAAAICTLFSPTSQAGPFSDQMARCIVDKTTQPEKIMFMQWLYAGMSKHPNLAGMSTISDSQGIRFSQLTADIVIDLMTDRCGHETKQAMRYEGENAAASAFKILGQVAMKELMVDQDVNSFISGLGRYIDEDAFDEIR